MLERLARNVGPVLTLAHLLKDVWGLALICNEPGVGYRLIVPERATDQGKLV